MSTPVWNGCLFVWLIFGTFAYMLVAQGGSMSNKNYIFSPDGVFSAAVFLSPWLYVVAKVIRFFIRQLRAED